MSSKPRQNKIQQVLSLEYIEEPAYVLTDQILTEDDNDDDFNICFTEESDSPKKDG